MKLILSPDEWHAVLVSPRTRYWMTTNDEHEMLKQAAPMLLAGAIDTLPASVIENATVIVDYGSRGVKLADPEPPTVLPSERLAREACDRACARATARRAAGHHEMKLIAVAWQTPDGYWLRVQTDDGYVWAKALLAAEIVALNLEEALAYAVRQAAEQVRRTLDGLIREHLDYPLHLTNE